MRDFNAEDKAMRERLERQSPSGARVNMAGMVSQMAARSPGLPGIAAFVLLRAVQAERRDTDRLNRKHDRMVAAGRIEGVVDEVLAKSAPDRPDRIDRRRLAARQFRARYW